MVETIALERALLALDRPEIEKLICTAIEKDWPPWCAESRVGPILERLGGWAL